MANSGGYLTGPWPGAGLDLFLRDNGAGMGAAELEWARLSITQLNDSASRQHGGLALGLAIATAIVELHGSALTLASEPRMRTTATLHLSAERVN